MTSPIVCLLKQPQTKQYHILVRTSNKTDVYLIRIDPQSGTLVFSATPGIDLFPSKEAAEQHLHTLGTPKLEASGIAVLGYVVIGYTGLVLILEKATVSAVLPGPVSIKTITASKWFRIPLRPILTPTQKQHISRNSEVIETQIRKILEFPLQDTHWYSDDADITRPFPSGHPRTQPCWQFVWNSWLSQSFRSIGCGDCCPALMHGTAESRDHEDVLGHSFTLVLLSRRSRLHAGTRYNARGLNQESEPANEIECEQIVWCKAKGSVEKFLWNRYSWRRGTVPIRWATKIKSKGLGKPEIRIARNQPFKGCKKYIRGVQKRFCPNQDSDVKNTEQSAEGQDSSGSFPVVFVSLLRKGVLRKYRSETNLAGAFDAALSIMRKTYELNTVYYPLDWHEMDKQLGTAGLVEALWTTMKGTLKTHGVASGEYWRKGAQGVMFRTAWLRPGTIQWHTQQQGLVRYNCADSLDRTNIASFFISVQVFVEQCRLLGLGVLIDEGESSSTSRATPTFNGRLFGNLRNGIFATRPRGGSVKSSPGQLEPTGSLLESGPSLDWESRGVGLTDHDLSSSSCMLPTEDSDGIESSLSRGSGGTDEACSSKAWALLDYPVAEVRRKVLSGALTSIAEVFLLSGDRSSFFYTGSQAMFANKLTIFEPETSRLKKNGVASSHHYIALKRRYNNVLKDSDRQAQIELFLGLNLEKHLSSSSGQSLKDLDSLNVVYTPDKVKLDFARSDDEDDDLNEEFAFASALQNSRVVVRDIEMQTVDTQRTRASPELQLSETSSSEQEREEELRQEPFMEESVVSR